MTAALSYRLMMSFLVVAGLLADQAIADVLNKNPTQTLPAANIESVSDAEVVTAINDDTPAEEPHGELSMEELRYRASERRQDKAKNRPKPLVITYDTLEVKNKQKNVGEQFDADHTLKAHDTFSATDNEDKAASGHLEILTDELKAARYAHQHVGAHHKWKGWGSKVHEVMRALRKVDGEQLVIVSDSRDVLVNTHEDAPWKFMETFDELVKDTPEAVVLGAESDCCTAAMNRVRRPGMLISESGTRNTRSCSSGYNGCLHEGSKFDTHWKNFQMNMAKERGFSDTQFPYLNAGLQAGKAKNLLRLYEYINMQDHEDDQALLTEAMYRKPEWVMLDYGQKLFGNNRWNQGLENGCLYKWAPEEKSFVQKNIGSKPFFMHTSGHFWSCYKQLHERLLVEQTKTDSEHQRTTAETPTRDFSEKASGMVDTTSGVDTKNQLLKKLIGLVLTVPFLKDPQHQMNNFIVMMNQLTNKELLGGSTQKNL